MNGSRDSEYPHLPQGREPGPQSRRQRTVLRILPPALGCGGLMFLAVVPVAIAVGEAMLIFGMAAGSIAFFAGAVGLWRKRKQPQAEHLTLEPSAVELRRGERLHVTLRVRDGASGDARIEIGLVCTERYDHWSRSRRSGGDYDKRTRTTSEAVAWEQWLPATRAAVQSFGFEIPAEAPFSWEGSALSFSWRVSARELKPVGFDPRRDAPLWVSP